MYIKDPDTGKRVSRLNDQEDWIIQEVADNIACLDYSVAKTDGKLVAYRWDGEGAICPYKFVAVERLY
jgi:hypothetical protein